MDGSISRRVILSCVRSAGRGWCLVGLSLALGDDLLRMECGERLTLANRLQRNNFVEANGETNGTATNSSSSPLKT
jgi:hypothetical protein